MSRLNGTLNKADVLVLGGGPAGCATSLALLDRGFSVHLVENSDYRTPRIGETLPPEIKALLSDLGVWDRFLSDHHHASYGNRSVWGSDRIRDNDFIFNPYGAGWHVDRRRFDLMMAEATIRAGASVLVGAELMSYQGKEKGEWNVEIECDGSRRALQTKFIVDATGRRASFALKQGAHRMIIDHLIGVVGFFSASDAEESSEHYTLVEATENGWWYSAQLPQRRMVAAYMTDADLTSKSSTSRENFFSEQLCSAPHTHSRLQKHVVASKPSIVSANTYLMKNIIGKNWLAIGDAAVAFDPLSSQGLYRALESGREAASVIENIFSGKKEALHEYAGSIEERFNEYLQARRIYYSTEARWPDSSFWKRRRV